MRGLTNVFAHLDGSPPPRDADAARPRLVGLDGGNADAAARNRLRLGIADDNDGIRAMLTAVFSLEPDFEIVGEAANGAQALELAERDGLDLLLLDLSMPELDGLEVLERLSSSRPDLPVVVYTGMTGDGVERRAQSLGARDVVLKGVPPTELVDRLRAAGSR